MITHCLQKSFKTLVFLTVLGTCWCHSAFAQYCTFVYRSYSTCVGGNITNVTFAGINNSVPCLAGGGYRDFTGSLPGASVAKGQSYPVSVTIGGASWLGGTTIWIDFDKNGTFDPAEQVFNGAYNGTTAVFTGNISIPTTALAGITTMRVVGTESGNPFGPCGSASDWGEAQDYKIAISGGGYNNAGISSFVSPVSRTFCAGNQDIKVKLSNNGKNRINNVAVEWQIDGIPQSTYYWSNTLDTTGGVLPSDTIISLGSVAFSGTTGHAIKVWTSFPNSVADTSNTDDTVSTQITPRVNCNSLPAYCTPNFSSWTSCIGGAVASVSLGAFSHSTPCMIGGGYRSMADSVLAPVIFPGQNIPVSLRIGSAYPTGGGGAIWMDLNRDGTFDPSELLFTGTYNSINPTPYTYTGNIVIPPGTTHGYVLMRVMGREGAVPSTTCGASSYGECNDYLVYIAASSPNNAAVTQVLPATQSFCAGMQDVKARVKNNGSGILNNVMVEWSVDGVAQSPLYWFSPIDTLGGVNPSDTLLTIGQVPFAAGVPRTIKVWTSMPNSVADTVNVDDTLQVVIEPSVVGACASYTLPTYCTPTFITWTSSCVGGNITNVSFAGINKSTVCTTGGNYYMNYTGSVSPAVVSPGKSYPVSIAVGGGGYAGGGAIWIDYNKNGVFEASEYAFVGQYTGVPQSFSGTINIPFHAPSGYTVMRVLGLESTTPSALGACNSGGYGEAQDYVIYIGERPSNNAAIVAQTAPIAFCAGGHDIKVRVANRGKNQINNLSLEWTINGVPQAPVSWFSVIDTFGGVGPSDTVLTVGANVFFPAGFVQNIKVWTSYPNSVADSTNADDTLSFSLKPALNGNYTIGSGGSYTTFTDAANDLNFAGICGNVTFDIAAGTTFNEGPIRFVNTGNGVDSVFFRKTGTGTNPIINSTGTSAVDDAAIDLRGARLVTFDGIDIRTTGPTLEYGYRLSNISGRGSSNNTISNCKIVLNRLNGSTIGLVQTSNAAQGGGVAATSFATSNHNNTYKNIRIENAYSGILLIGDYTYPDTNCIVTSEGADTTIIGGTAANDIGNGSLLVYGIGLTAVRNATVSHCVVRNLTHTGSSTVQGIYIDNSASGSYGTVNVKHNIVHNVDRTSTSTSTSSHAHGIRVELVASATAHVYNNVVYNITSTGNTASANTGLAVRGMSVGTTSGNGVSYFINNSVQVNNPSLNRTSAAFWKAGNGSTIVQNNVLSNVSANQSSTAKHYAVYRSSGPITASNNLLWTQNTNGFTGYYTSDQATMQNWRTASLQDVQSFFYRPAFTSATHLVPNPADAAAWAMNGRALHNPEVSADLLGTLRPASVVNGTPDIGAYEFTPSAVAPVAVAVPATPVAGGTQVFFFAEDTVAKITWDAFAAVPASVSVRFYSGVPPYQLSLSANQVLNCYGSIDMSPGAHSYAATLHYKDIWVGSIQNLLELKPAKRPVPGIWSADVIGTADTVARTVTTSTTGDASVLLTGAFQYDALPVKLIRFSASKQNTDVLLNWKTATEKNAKGFVIERSADGKTWAVAGFVKAAGAGSYSFTDARALDRSRYLVYRLKITDLDGSFEYSDLVAVNNSNNAAYVEVYPNPFTDRVSVEFSAEAGTAAAISISDITGKTIATETFLLNEGINILNPSLATFKAGVYFITITSGEHTIVKKVVKQ